MRKLLISITVIFCAILLFQSCNEDDDILMNSNTITNEEFFINKSKRNSQIVKKAKEINNLINYVPKISDQVGLPSWGNAISFSNNSVTGKGNEEKDDFIVVPLI